MFVFPSVRYGSPYNTDYRIIVENLSTKAGWQVIPFIIHACIGYSTMLKFLLKNVYCKGPIKSPGAYLILDTPEEGLNREGGLFTKSNDKDIRDGFLVPLCHFLWIQDMILQVKYINSTQFLPET